MIGAHGKNADHPAPDDLKVEAPEIIPPNNHFGWVLFLLSHPTVPGWSLIIAFICAPFVILAPIVSIYLFYSQNKLDQRQSEFLEDFEDVTAPNVRESNASENENQMSGNPGIVLEPTLGDLNAAGSESRSLQSPSLEGPDQRWVVRLQRALAAAGYDPGPDDGLLGFRTWSAAESFAENTGVLLPEIRSMSRTGFQEFVLNIEREIYSGNEISVPVLHPDREGLEGTRVEYEPGVKFRDCAFCPEMVVLPTGSFFLGSPQDERGRDDDEDDLSGPGGRPVAVSIVHSFAIGVFEVTQEEWAACVQSGICRNDFVLGASLTRGLRGSPVVNVSWFDAQAYVAYLRSETNEPYRLLSEAEWEYAARAGDELLYFDADAVGPSEANFGHAYGGGVMQGGLFEPNAFGVYDLLGNAWEWVEDCYLPSYAGLPPSGRPRTMPNCSRRVIRGGGWDGQPRDVRPANRGYDRETNRTSALGFRVARDL